GNKIQASCKKNYLLSLGADCRVGEWKNLENFVITPAGGGYRPTNHPYKLSFMKFTSIKPYEYNNIDMFLDLVEFETILSGQLDNNLLIDVVGQAIDIGENLSDVSPIKFAWSVLVKVLHTWISFSHQFGSSLEMVLTDINGVKIHASCKQELLQRVERQCGVGEWKVITNFTLRPASGLNRPTNHVYKMEFMEQTSITDGNLTCNNMFIHLHDFDNIKNGFCDERFLIDVIGEVLDFRGQNIVKFERKEVTKVEFNLRDIKNQRIQCCITGKSAEIFSEKVKQSNREWKVTNAFDSTLVLINPDIKEAKALRQKFQGDATTVEMCQHINEKIVIHEKRQKWSQYPFRTIQEMKYCDKGGNYRVICSVYAVDTINGWYYYACADCQNKVIKPTILFDEPEVPSWWCEFCQRIVTKVTPRYKLELLVQDQTGETKFTLLDSVATSIVKISAAKVVKGLLEKVEIQAMLPPEIVEIVGKSYGFGISVDENNNSSGLEKIEAMKVWGLKDILWKRTKSLHQNSTTSRKKQCTNVFKINESG
ncbi:hypothetical protein IGI04_025317, partial [Brassica rapa subsp. trilocularis]